MPDDQKKTFQHLSFATNAIRSGYKTTNEQEHSEAIFLTSSFVFKNAKQAARRFAKEEEGNIYSRFTNPSVRAFEKRLATLECGADCQATASGMAAIFSTIMSLLEAGNHIVASRNMFGTTIVLLEMIVSKFNIRTTFVDLSDTNAWQQAIKPNTRLFLLETPSNPLSEIVDLKKLSKVAKEHNILLAVDNVCSPALQKPLTLGAHLVIHSATKYIDGQGRVLAGAVVAGADLIEKIHSFIRTTGPSLSAFDAWVVLKGLETLELRMQKHSESALILANWLSAQSQVKKVYYLGLPSHPQHELAKAQQLGFGGLVSFEIDGGKERAWQVIDGTNFLSITANLGDAKTTITHPATTTHARLSDAEKERTHITPALIRISVGLEDIGDVITDIARGLLV